LADLLDRHVGVIAAWQGAVDPEERVPLISKVQVAGDLDGVVGDGIVACVIAVTAGAAAPTPGATVVGVDVLSPVVVLFLGVVLVSATAAVATAIAATALVVLAAVATGPALFELSAFFQDLDLPVGERLTVGADRMIVVIAGAVGVAT
jgi:hypothetical protein